MSYNLNIAEFNVLLTDNNDITELHLTSYDTSYGKYKVVRYNKDILYVANAFGVFRSVVLNNNNEIISFAPPKSLSIENFSKLNPTKLNNIVAEEFVEGTMINVFWDTQLNKWNIATRNTVGADVSFFKTDIHKTFNSMFYETLTACKLDLNNLNKLYCYSFVLQHPENRIVVPIQTPTLYLVQVYQITEKMVDVISMDTIRSDDLWKSTNIKFPVIYDDWNSYDDLNDKYASTNTPYNLMGVIIKNTETNDRCKIRNPVYEDVRLLKGNQPKLQYHYLSLRKTGKIAEYLRFYPECKKNFSKYRDQLHAFTNALFVNYVSCYIKKEKPLGEFSGQYKTHMFKIHKMYLDELKEKKLFVTNSVVIQYVNNLHESQQLHSLHYHLKKQFVDSKKVE
jgi:hypothetical protein